ncbi:protein MOS2-like [Papaver somniferum]|uniref:protein MOS2-like n=1 Tax=Papaver somniferum TaxID=3469 RepID=UPI000E6F47F0|nr:protein MOS2-like [Papaver somniferum]XP_026382173.1 protein MOS2-like [Papaver somniferum]XP_026382174.1 protein MOS2-like [Papaver somniferum]XP_026382175.1 protein MOS2-like [Papaver somniferum]
MSNLQSLATKSYSATDDPETRFEREAAPPTTVADQGFKYGLTLRKKDGSEVDDNSGKSRVVVSSSSINVNLPEDRVDFPYAEALLAGYGWKKGQGIGKNAKEEVQVVQYVGWTERLGLVYEPHGSRETKKRKIQGETRNAAKHDNSTGLSQKGGKVKGDDPSWLISHIRVRVVSKTFRGGKLYMKKGEIVDVVERSVCDIAMDESKEVIQGVKQDILETVIPRCGGAVLILYGKHKGVFGNLVLDVHLEQIAEYIGDPSHLGY